LAKRRKTAAKGSSVIAAASAGQGSRVRLLYLLLLILTTFITYNPARSYPFTNFDDDTYVTANPHVQAGLSPATVTWAFTTYDFANWHPLTWLSHALDCELFGLDPVGPHEVNLLLHVVNVLLLFWVLDKATGMTGRSALVAALFALHPINVETVAWVAERKNLLSLLLLLLALAAYRRYTAQPRLGRYLLVCLLFALGSMAKPQVITLPFLLLLWDYWPLERLAPRQKTAFRFSVFAFRQNSSSPEISGKQRRANSEKRSSEWRFLLLEKLPLLAISAASAVITLKAQQAGHAVQSLTRYPVSLRLENAVISYARYLAKAIWPSSLAVLYPFPRTSPPLWQLLIAMFVLAAITGLVFARRKHRYLIVGWLWFLGSLVPMIGVVQVGKQAMADRYAYLSFIGLFVMFSWGVADVAEARRVSAAWARAMSVALLLILAAVTRHQLRYWQDNVSLWSHAAETTTGNYIAEDSLGELLLRGGDVEQAMLHFRRALAIDPHDGVGHLALAGYAQHMHRWPEAIAAYKQAISEINEVGTVATAYSNLGYAYLHLGDQADARDSFQRAVQLSPDMDKAWQGLGVSAQNSGDLASAIRSYNRANEIRPSSFGYALLARALERSGRSQEGAAALQTARRLPGFASAQHEADGLVGP